ncbi:phage distal tail protein [Paenibacillus daejeonensis]|uniref:phage distal tail protein n=1 Tax=Paenibacillus daejeonensis TaxID=135193 RepID=UPI000373FA61|nr:phage tail domain-containing protein [Paenibacillus daejeonensis]
MYAPFNRAPFNRPSSFSTVIYGGGTVEAEVEVEGRFLREIRAGGEVEAAVEVLGSFIREVVGVPGPIEIETEVLGSFLREMKANPQPVELAVEVLGAGSRWRVDQIAISGTLAPGEKIVIDVRKLKVTKNGVLVGYTGDFFNINPGRNEIRYTDSSPSRSVQTRVTHQDRYL